MKIEEYVVLTFNSTHHTLSGEKIFKDNDIGFKTIPTPREITLSCGLSILFALEDLEKVKDLIKKDVLAIKGVYRYNIKGKEKTVTEIEWW